MIVWKSSWWNSHISRGNDVQSLVEKYFLLKIIPSSMIFSLLFDRNSANKWSCLSSSNQLGSWMILQTTRNTFLTVFIEDFIDNRIDFRIMQRQYVLNILSLVYFRQKISKSAEGKEMIAVYHIPIWDFNCRMLKRS